MFCDKLVSAVIRAPSGAILDDVCWLISGIDVVFRVRLGRMLGIVPVTRLRLGLAFAPFDQGSANMPKAEALEKLKMTDGGNSQSLSGR